MNTPQQFHDPRYFTPNQYGNQGVSFTIPPPLQPPAQPKKLGKLTKAAIVAGVTLFAAVPILFTAVGVNLAVTDYATANLTPHKFSSATTSQMVPKFSPSFQDWTETGVAEDGTVAYVNDSQTCELFVADLAGVASEATAVDFPYTGERDREATEQLIAALAGTTRQQASPLLGEGTLTTPLGAPVDVVTVDGTDEAVASLARLFVASDQGFSATLLCDTVQEAKTVWGGVVEDSTVKLTNVDSHLRQPQV